MSQHYWMNDLRYGNSYGRYRAGTALMLSFGATGAVCCPVRIPATLEEHQLYPHNRGALEGYITDTLDRVKTHHYRLQKAVERGS